MSVFFGEITLKKNNTSKPAEECIVGSTGYQFALALKENNATEEYDFCLNKTPIRYLSEFMKALPQTMLKNFTMSFQSIMGRENEERVLQEGAVSVGEMLSQTQFLRSLSLKYDLNGGRNDRVLSIALGGLLNSRSQLLQLRLEGGLGSDSAGVLILYLKGNRRLEQLYLLDIESSFDGILHALKDSVVSDLCLGARGKLDKKPIGALVQYVSETRILRKLNLFYLSWDIDDDGLSRVLNALHNNPYKPPIEYLGLPKFVESKSVGALALLLQHNTTLRGILRGLLSTESTENVSEVINVGISFGGYGFRTERDLDKFTALGLRALLNPNSKIPHVVVSYKGRESTQALAELLASNTPIETLELYRKKASAGFNNLFNILANNRYLKLRRLILHVDEQEMGIGKSTAEALRGFLGSNTTLRSIYMPVRNDAILATILRGLYSNSKSKMNKFSGIGPGAIGLSSLPILFQMIRDKKFYIDFEDCFDSDQYSGSESDQQKMRLRTLFSSDVPEADRDALVEGMERNRQALVRGRESWGDLAVCVSAEVANPTLAASLEHVERGPLGMIHGFLGRKQPSNTHPSEAKPSSIKSEKTSNTSTAAASITPLSILRRAKYYSNLREERILQIKEQSCAVAADAGYVRDSGVVDASPSSAEALRLTGGGGGGGPRS